MSLLQQQSLVNLSTSLNGSREMACRKMNEDFAYARNTESGCKKAK